MTVTTTYSGEMSRGILLKSVALMLVTLFATSACSAPIAEVNSEALSSGSAEPSNSPEGNQEQASSNPTESPVIDLKADKCSEILSSMPFGVGTAASTEPYGGIGRTQWQANDELYAQYSELDTANEGVVCFRNGLIRQLEAGKSISIQNFRNQLESLGEEITVLYYIPFDDLLPLADFLYRAGRGEDVSFDVANFVAGKSADPVEQDDSIQNSSESEDYVVALGESCPTLGQSLEGANGRLECRYASGMKMVWVDPDSNAQIELIGSQPVNWDACRIRDQRREIRALGTAFEITNFIRMNNPTNANIAIVPIDFPDAKANKSVSQYFDSQIAILNSLVRQWAGSNQKYTWHMPKDWIRMPREAKYYSYDKQTVNNATAERESAGFDQILSTEEQAFEIFSLAEQVMDLSNIDFVYLIAWPTTEAMFPPYSHDRNVVTATTTYDWPYYGFGYFVLNDFENRPLWQFLIHELLHFRGVAGHGPRQENNELFYNVMGSGLSMYAWDAFLMGWLEKNQLLCFDKTSLEESEFTLSSSDTGYGGPRAAMIRLSSTRVLVVETRRIHPYNIFLPDGFAALHAYEVDSTKSGERLADQIHAVYLTNDSGRSEILPNQKDSRRRFGDSVNAYPGDTFTFDGIKITYLETGKLDRIRIERVG